MNVEAINKRITAFTRRALEEHQEILAEQLETGRDVKVTIGAKIDKKAIEFSISIGTAPVKAPKTAEQLDDPNQPELIDGEEQE